MEWLCWHVGTVGDPKFVAVAKRAGVHKLFAIGMWGWLLERAKGSDEPGTFGKFDHEDASIALDIPEDKIKKLLAAFREKAMISETKISNWAKRQHGTSTDRVRAFRERKKHDETLRNVSETHETLRNGTGQDRTGQDIKNLNTTTVPVAARETNGSSNGHDHGSRNGKPIDLNSAGGASRPFPRNGAYTPEQREEKWFLNCQDWMREHWPPDRTARAVADFLEGNRNLINLASDERAAAVASGKLRETISPSPKRKAPQI